MHLSEAEVEQFYAAWLPLIAWVNQQRNVVATFPTAPPYPPADVRAIRDVLWADDALRHRFVAENPAHLATDLLALIASWDHRRAGTFTIWKHFKKHSIFLDDHGYGYAVLGLRSELEEMLPIPAPLFVKTVLIPFKDRIVYDSILETYSVFLGPGIRRSTKASYDDAVERNAILHSLVPATPEEHVAHSARDRATTNARVLEQFRKSLLKKGLSEKIIERDLGIVRALAEGMPSGTLRECTVEDVEAQVAAAATLFGGRRETVTALKRFFKFVQTTGRTSYDQAQDVLDWLATYG
jgi:hypothetical protein